VTVTGVLLLAGIGIAGGIISTVAGVASVVSYPALLAFGLPPLAANMTNTFALLFTGAGAAAGSRPELAGQGTRIRGLGPTAALGGGAGAALLLATPAGTFVRVAPVLIAGASLVLLAPPRVRGGQDEAGAPGEPRTAAEISTPAEISTAAEPRRRGGRGPGRRRALLAAFFASTVYVGYFGAAGGILLLATLTRLWRGPVARANALKNVTSGFANTVAAVTFAAVGHVDWAVVPPLAAGFLAGGWTGPALARRLPGRALRILVACTGLAVAVRLALSAYS
jgi:uncharacterized membrane protein YfcA